MGFLSSLFGVKDRTPATSTNVVSQKLPPEIAPAVKRAVDEATAIFEAEKARGYDPYTGETIAPFTPEEQQAMAGIAGLVGTATPLVQESLETYRTGAEKFTPETAQEYMSPYQRAVTDIEKREAGRQFDVAQQARDAQAAEAGAGSLMGTRSAILEAEAARNQQQLLADIEARGLQSAFTNAQQQFAAQKARERQMAGDVARTGTGLFQAGLAEQGALQTVGEQKRGLGQSALDEAYARFLEERNFPQQTLADFTTTIYGNPLSRMPTKTTTGSKLPGAASPAQQALGLGLSGLNIFGMGGGFNPGGFSMGNLFKAEGGPLIEAREGTVRTPLQKQIYGLRPRIFGARKPATGRQLELLKELEKEDRAATRYGSRTPLDPGARYRRYEPSQLMGGRGNLAGPTAPAIGSEIERQEKLAKARQQASYKEGTMDSGYKGGRGEGGLPALMSKSDATIVSSAGKKPDDLLGPLTKIGYQRPDGSVGVYPINEISGGIIRSMDVRPNIEKKIREREKLLSRDPRFDIGRQRKRGEKGIADTLNILKSNLAARKAIQEEGYTEEEKANQEFIDKQEKLVEELGGYPGDIIGEALDQGMDQPTIATMLAKTLNLSAKGLGKRKKEINKELRSLNKNTFELEKEMRKGKRTDKLTNLEKDGEIKLKEIASKLGLEKQLDQLPYELKKEVREQLTAVATMEGTEIDKTVKAHQLIINAFKAHTERMGELSDKIDPPKGADYNALLKSIDSKLDSIIDEERGTIGGQALDGAARTKIANIKTNAERILGGMATYKGRTGSVAAREYANDKINALTGPS
tara:strand:- start:1363 stop:3792 length:2430 start_codon:yes stop_codon:yes gene_type:complete